MEMNTETAAHDLIARMMLVNEHGMSKQHIKDNMDFPRVYEKEPDCWKYKSGTS